MPAAQVRARTRPAPASALAGETVRRELYFFNLFRVLQAAVYTGLAFSPLAVQWVVLSQPLLARVTAVLYLLFALIALAQTRQWLPKLSLNVAIALSVDVLAALLAILSMHDARTGIATMLIVSVGAGALLLPLRLGMFFAALAALALLGHTFAYSVTGNGIDRDLLESGLFGIAYFAIAWLSFALGTQMRETEALAEQRGLDLANLGQVNDMIIRRMKTGVLLVDEGNRIHQFNESAWLLLGKPVGRAPRSRHRGAGAVASALPLAHHRQAGRNRGGTGRGRT